ncbi:hypothetical protein N7468_001010 [Penicillium chermesinum]|uniref:Cytochrome P450 n=1 Tax=Penicillium chermesinum TaxID=63820 RepID=A0A9W9PIT4_9EURO|nr:uncharacterized protein N7468_001010 [Penicillium chermesinum]KAJ5246027.1 hypothetical protein N7468_001010 [Penicillium chermesinum]
MAVSISSVSIVVLLLAFVYKAIIYPAFVSPLAKIPNAHWSAPISPAWILWRRFRMTNNRTIQAAHARLGPIVRLGPSEISVNCVEGGIKSVYTGGFEKHEWYPRVFGSLDTVSMFTMIGSKPHSIRKRMLSNVYSKSTLQSSPHLQKISHAVVVERLLPIIQSAASTEKPIDVHDLNMGLTMDFVSAYLLGLANGTNHLQDDEYRKHWLHLYFSRKPYEFYHQEVPNLAPRLKRLGWRVIPKHCDQANEALDAWVLNLCDKAARSLDSTDPSIEPVVYKQLKHALDKQSAKEGSKPAPLQQKNDIACEIYDQLTAGFETSAVGLTYLFWELSQHPEIQTQLRAELRTLKPPLTSPGAELPSPKAIDSLPLLEAVVTETLRLHAPIPGIQPRVTPAPSCTLAGYENIPPNTRVNAQAYSLHRNPAVYPEPEAWRPERWLKSENSVAELEERRRWFWAFGSGGRIFCAGGRGLEFGSLLTAGVMLESKLVVAAIYSNFETTIVDDTDIEAIDAYTVHPRGQRLVLKFNAVA